MNFDIDTLRELAADRLSFVSEVPGAMQELATLASTRTTPVCTFRYTNELNGAFGDFVDDSLYLAIAIPDSVEVDWTKQVTDWLIPHCEANHESQTNRALVLLGDGPIAPHCCHCARAVRR